MGMTNREIIAHAAIMAGLFTETGEIMPLYTFYEWKKKGYHVKYGEKAALTCSLWKQVQTKVNDVDTEKMVLAKAYLFTPEQVQKVSVKQPMSKEQLIAYNKMLMQQRKVAT